MTSAQVPFVNAQKSGFEELGGASPIAMNVIVEGGMSVKRRPGIKAYSGAPSSVIDVNGLAGLYSTTKGQLFAVGASGAERPIYYLTSTGSTKLGGGTPPSGLRGTRRPTFAETDMLLAVAGGDSIEKIVLSGPAPSRLGGSPPKASHVIANASRLLANDTLVDPNAVRFSDVAGGSVSYAGHEVWSYGGFGTSGYFTAEGRPDAVQAVLENTNEVTVCGTTTTQVFRPDPIVTYAPVGTTEIGLLAPYSPIKVDGQYAWLDNLRRLIITNGRSFKTLSDPIARTLDAIGTVSDCFGYRVTLGPLDLLLWSFPTDGRTFCYQQETGWGQWSGWNDSANTWSAFAVTAASLTVDGNVLVATSDGRVGALSLDANTDFGTRINAYVETGYQNRDTDAYKHCECLRMTFRRGENGTPGPSAFLAFRDRPGAWSDPIPLDLGSSGDTEPVVEIRSLGTYRRRQWRFTFSDAVAALSLVSAVEEFTVER